VLRAGDLLGIGTVRAGILKPDKVIVVGAGA